MASHGTCWRLLAAACMAVACSPGNAEEIATIRPLGFEGAAATVRAVLTLPAAALRPTWDAEGGPVIVVVPDHLGLDERAEFHTTALLAAGIAVLGLDIAPGTGVNSWSRLVPREARINTADGLLPALFGALRALDAERPSRHRAVGVLGFGAGGEAAVVAAHEAVAEVFLPGPDAPRFRAHAAFYPACDGSFLRGLRNTHAPTTKTPILVVLAHDGGPGDDPGGCGVFFDHKDPHEPDPFIVRAYPWMYYGFDLWPAVAAIAARRHQPFPGGMDSARFDAASAELARRDLAAVLIPALVPVQRP
jgi:dienelactone hydrolase